MSAAPPLPLLAESLRAWRIAGEVRAAADGAVLVRAGGQRLRIQPAPPGLPFRWMVASGTRRRGATSVSSLLRVVRAMLDPDHAGSRLRIAAPLPPADAEGAP
ncbi:hypothetical protein [Caldovatus aquaticus]|uniref:hypothetical protein n=1 Tax=Caldovatus aquaticus TaxID=2865671 RepID=UPI002107BB27|nr:hypothetical protein [Caldovatus aquaticus]